MTLRELKRKAKIFGFMIRLDGHGNFIIADADTNSVASYPAVLTLEQVKEWLDDYEAIFGND